jgi:geranylgeranyl diphosphate synthase type I
MTSNIKSILNKYALDIKHFIKHVLSDAPPFIHGVISYHFGWGDQNFEPANYDSGKMLRPTMCLLVFDALTGSHKNALPVAAAIEMIHNFSLIHDDIEDGDTERRGRPTAWAIWGKPLAINTGDYLYTLAFNTIANLDSTKFDTGRILAVQRLITGSCLTLTMGQDLDLRFEQTQNVSTEMYLDMVYKKTGALLEAAIVSGAMLGTSDQKVISNYHEFARNIGIAFQVRDDILGIWGDTSTTGKSADNDLRRKKKTLPVLYTLGQVTGERKERLRAMYASPDPLSKGEINFARECLTWADARGYAQDKADTYMENAFSALNRIDISNQAQSDIEAIAKFLVQRSY